MPEYPIVVIDTDEERADYFKSRFLRDEHNVDIYNDIISATKNSAQHTDAAFIVEFDTLTISDRMAVIEFYKEFTRQNIFMYNVPDNANKRLAFYELGAKRVFDTSQTLEEIYYGLKWPLRNWQAGENKNVLISSGTLEDVSINSLLSTLAREERSGILKMVTPYNSGKIYFREGFIIHAQVGLLKGERALMHMLFWTAGSFSFAAAAIGNEKESVRISKVALLCLAESIRQKYLEDLQKIGTMSAIVQVKFIDSLQSSALEMTENFKELVARPTVLSKILENSVYTCFETAEKLAALKDEGFLFANEQDKSVAKKLKQKQTTELPISDSNLLDTKEATEFSKNINLESNSGKVFIIDTDEKSANNFLARLVSSGSEIISNEDLHFCNTALKNKAEMIFYSLTINKLIIDTIEKYATDIKAIIFIINEKVDSNPEYSRYIISRLTKIYDVPWVTMSEKVNSKKIDNLKSNYGIPKHIPLIEASPVKNEDAKNVLLQVKEYQPKIEKTKDSDQEEKK